MVILTTTHIRKIMLPSDTGRFYTVSSRCLPGMHHNNATCASEYVPTIVRQFGDGLPSCGQYTRPFVTGDILVSDFDVFNMQVNWNGQINLWQDGIEMAYCAQGMLDRGAEVF